MPELICKSVLSYLMGSLMGGLIVGRLRGGVDIRTLGSGNAGGTNALRTQGKEFALWVVLIDVGKGVIATAGIAQLSWAWGGEVDAAVREWLPAICGIAVILGHVYPAWYGFRGGKGAATLVGALLGLDAFLLLPMTVTWLAAVATTGFVSLASMIAAIALPAYVAWSGHEPQRPLLIFGVIVAALVLFTHRSNIARMLAGREPRAQRLWLLGRRRG